MTELGLGEHHESQIVNYMRFARYQRGQKLRSVTACFRDTKDTRLQDDTYTRDEVVDLLDGLCSLVKSEVESELINSAHTSVLLLKQAFHQAEQWHLKLQIDTSELENRDLLEKIRSFEEEEFSGKRRAKSERSPTKLRLEPLKDVGATALLNLEIERLKEENLKLKDRIKLIETQATGALQDKSCINLELQSAQEELLKLRNSLDSSCVEKETMFEVQDEMALVKKELESSLQASSESQQRLENDLTNTKHRLLEIQAQLELAEKELEKKFQQTGAYANMKKMMVKKNDTIKDLRDKLSKFTTDEEDSEEQD